MFFIALFYFLIVQEAPLYFTFKQMKATIEAKELESGTSKTLATLQSHTLDELITTLQDRTPLEEGILVRDVALSLLTEKFHFDLQRALLGFPEPAQRELKVALPDGISRLTLYTNLNDAHYKAILDFAKHELFPVTDAHAPVAPPPKVEIVEKGEPSKALMQESQGLHIVQEGESLWKISRLHKVDIDLLRSFNQLKSDQIRPGQALRLP